VFDLTSSNRRPQDEIGIAAGKLLQSDQRNHVVISVTG
jgi:hypothetical protein